MAGIVYTATEVTLTDANDENVVLITFTNNNGSGGAALSFTASIIYNTGTIASPDYLVSTPSITLDSPVAPATSTSSTYTIPIGTAAYDATKLFVGVAFAGTVGP